MYIVPRQCGHVAVYVFCRCPDLDKLRSVRIAISNESFQDLKIRNVDVTWRTVGPKLLIKVVAKREGYVSVDGLRQLRISDTAKFHNEFGVSFLSLTDVTTPQLFILCPHAAALKSRCDKSDCISTVPAVSPKLSSKMH